MVRGYVDASNAGDGAAVIGALAEDASFTLWGDLPVSGTYAGRRAIVEQMMPAARELFQPGTLQLTIETLAIDGRRAFAEVSSTGTSAAGAPYEGHYCMVFELAADGRIEAIREYMDTAYARRVLCP